jgi:hypothetical protein
MYNGLRKEELNQPKAHRMLSITQNYAAHSIVTKQAESPLRGKTLVLIQLSNF